MKTFLGFVKHIRINVDPPTGLVSSIFHMLMTSIPVVICTLPVGCPDSFPLCNIGRCLCFPTGSPAGSTG